MDNGNSELISDFHFSFFEINMTKETFNVGVVKPVECMKEGWELIKDDFWRIFAITSFGMLIGGLIPFGIGIGAMFCGIYYVLLKKMNRENYEFGDLFKGFSFFIPGLIVSLIVVIPAVISGIFIYGTMIAFFISSVDSHGRINESVMYGMFGTIFIEAVILAIVMSCLHALIMFAFPLIAERNMKGVEAFKLSAKSVWANLSGVVGIILLEFVMGFAAYLLTFFIFGLGVYLVMPIMFAGVLVAYKRVFPDLNENKMPPPPNAYL